MTKLMKYLKPFTLPLVLVIVLLFGQAQCELALPDLMSDIVDTGIQKSGITDGVASVIRESQYQKMTIFMNESEQKQFMANYQLIEYKNASTEQKEAYPVLEKENIYELKDISDDVRDSLNKILVEPMMLVTEIEKSVKDPESELMQEMPDAIRLQLEQGLDIFTILPMMPQNELSEMRSGVSVKLEALGSSSMKAAGATVVKAEYQAIGMDTDSMQSDYIISAGTKMLLVALCSAVAAILVGLLASRIGSGFARSVRKEVFTKVESFSNSEFNQFSTSSLITRTTNDVQQVQMVIIMFLRMVAYAPIIGIGAIIHVLNSEASMTWIIALCVIVLLSLIGVLMSIAMPKFKISQKLLDNLNSVTRGILEGMPVIRAFNTQKHEEENFDKANKDKFKTDLFINRTMSFMMPAMMFVMNGASLLIVWVGGHQIAEGTLQIGDMLAFIQYAMQIIMAFLMIAMISVMLPRASVSAKRIHEVLSTENSIKDPKEPKHFDASQRGCVNFEHVCFRYPGAEEDVLHDISFTAKPGETTAFIGSTGSGKSTIINLVPRFFDVTGGRILVDGVDIREVTQHELREKIGYVPQKGVLFSGTIESNLRYANEHASESDLKMASSVAQAMEFIESKPEGYDTPISQGGTNVSGGQKQRLSIARALVKKPEIYIFDDSFSALDFKTDAKLRSALSAVTKETKATVLLVAQRISSIMHAERIVVLDKGSVAGIGTHEELMKTCEVYQEIAYSQLSKEELGNE